MQLREKTNLDYVEELAETIGDNGWPTDIPPCIVFYDGSSYWLADGHHRYLAAQRAGNQKVLCDIRRGDKTAALWHAIGSNATHGLRRTNEDKRRAVELAYQLEPSLSDREIARRACVSNGMASSLLRERRKPTAPVCNLHTVEPTETASPLPVCNLHTVEESPPAPGLRGDNVITPNNSTGRDRGKAKPGKPAPNAADVPPAASELDAIVRQLRECQTRLNAVARSPGCELLRSNYLKLKSETREGETVERLYSPDLANAVKELEHWRPHSACPSCRENVRPGCELCRGTGWITAATWERLPERLKNKVSAEPNSGHAKY